MDASDLVLHSPFSTMLTSHAEGVVLEVKAQPGARRDELRGEQDGALKVCVTQVPEKGKANKAIKKLLSKSLSLRASQIELLSGETGARKQFLLRDTDLETIRQTITDLDSEHRGRDKTT